MEAGLTPDPVSVGVEGNTLTSDDGVELGEAVEVPIDDRLVDMDPQRLSWLEFGSVGRQVNEPDALGHDESGRAVPAGIVEHEQDDAVPSGARLPGEEREHVLEVALGNAGGEMTCNSRRSWARQRR